MGLRWLSWNRVKNAVVTAVAIVVAIVQPEFIPALGEALGFSGTAATAAGTAAFNTSLNLAAGEDLGTSLQRGVASGVGQYVGVEAGGGPLGSAAGSATQTALSGGQLSDVIRNAVAGGVGASVADYTNTAVGQAAKQFISTGDIRSAVAAGLSAEITSDIRKTMGYGPTTGGDTATTTPTPVQPTAPSYVPTSQDVAARFAGGGYGEAMPQDVTLPETEPDTGDRVTVTGRRFQEPLLPTSFGPSRAPQAPSAPEQPTAKEEAPQEKKTQNLFLASFIKPGAPSAVGKLTSLTPAAFGSTAPASAAYTPAGEMEYSGTGKPRREVWNEASLRLKDALGL